MSRESAPDIRPAQTVLTQRVIAKEAELKSMTLILEEVMSARSTKCTADSWEPPGSISHGESQTDPCHCAQAQERLQSNRQELHEKEGVLQQKADSYKPIVSTAGPVRTSSVQIWTPQVAQCQEALYIQYAILTTDCIEYHSDCGGSV